MFAQILLVTHIAVLGYWLGSEFVINHTYRYVSYAGDMPFAERDRLMDHVMHVDQHVRYALVLQAALGFALAALYGYIPGGEATATIALIAGAVWLGFVEVTHRLRHKPAGKAIAAFDRRSRYVFMAVLLSIAVSAIGGSWDMPSWLRLKVGLFACVMASGVGIRIALIGHFRTWSIMAREGPNDETNAIIRKTYVRATSILVLLWVFIAAMVAVSVLKPF